LPSPLIWKAAARHRQQLAATMRVAATTESLSTLAPVVGVGDDASSRVLMAVHLVQ
jgi:hypothetical protein